MAAEIEATNWLSVGLPVFINHYLSQCWQDYKG